MFRSHGLGRGFVSQLGIESNNTLIYFNESIFKGKITTDNTEITKRTARTD